MTRLENVINQVKVSRTGKNHAWIFNNDGKIGDNVVCGEVLDLLEELKEYEINVSDAWIENFLHNPRVKGDNTYNFNANISNDINIDYLVTDDGAEIMVIMVHLTGDIRGNYTDYFAVKFDDIDSFYTLDSLTQCIDINDRFTADVFLLSETYSVYDCENGESVGEFYELEKEDLLAEIEKVIA